MIEDAKALRSYIHVYNMALTANDTTSFRVNEALRFCADYEQNTVKDSDLSYKFLQNSIKSASRFNYAGIMP